MDGARKFVDKGQVDKAIKEYLRVVKEDPQDVRVWLKVGDLYAKKGSKQEASETYLKVARFYQDQGFFLKAVAVYKQILKLDPRLVEVNLKLAELYRQLGLLSDAMQHFESVAAHFHREGKTKEALATVRQLVDLDPENIATRIKLAELYSKEAMNVEAVAEFQVACDQLRKQARVDDFVKVAERLLFHKADNLPLNREMAVLYLRRNDPRRALQKLQACFKADPRDVETLALLAQAFQALDQKSKTVSVLKELARVFDENKQRDKAEEVHRKILQFVPQDPDSLAYLGDKAPKAGTAAAKASLTPGPSAAVAAIASGRGTGGQPRLNFTSEVQALGSPPQGRMTGSMPLVEAPDFELPEDAGLDAQAPLPDEDFSEELQLEENYSARNSSIAGEEHAEEIAKILTETDVYIKYGLHQKAIDHLRRVFALDGENLEARERMKDVLLSQGREREAIAELMHLGEATAQHDPDRAEGYLRELLAVDGTYKPAFDLARRFKLDIAGHRPAGSEGEIDLDSDQLAAGGVAPVDDDLDLDGIDFHEGRHAPSQAVGVTHGGGHSPGRAESFDGIDPQMFGGGHHRIGGMPETTRQVAASEVEALAAMSNAPRSLEFEDGVVETPPPPIGRGAAWSPQTSRSLDDVLDEHLDDALGEDIDQEVASELSQQVRMPSNGTGYELGYDDDVNAEFELPSEDGGEAEEIEPEVIADEDLPFDPRAARAFDMGLRSGSSPKQASSEGYEVPPTFDPAAAALFDADEPLEHPLAYGSPSAADLGAAPADRFDSMGLSRSARPGHVQVVDDDLVEGVGEPSATIDVGPEEIERLAQSYDGGYTVDAPLESPDAPDEAPYSGTADAPYEQAPRAASSLEDDLDEVDFYVSQNMMVEAAEILHALLARHPGHPLISAKLRDVETAVTGYAAEEPVEAVDNDAIEEELVARASGGTENIDLDEIEELEPEDDLGEPVLEEQPAPRKKKPAVVLERPVEEGDAETHYDLGLAYKEMGLYDEAIKAFEKLTGNPVRAVQCRLMIGLCRRDQGNFSEAVHAFKAGLHAREVNEREKQSLYYEIGVAYEAMGDAREALYYFEMVTKRDPSFLDAGDRAARLRGGHGRDPRQGPGDDSDVGIDALLDDA